jgi:glycosyltransferase involved in cell wall biosynthesis
MGLAIPQDAARRPEAFADAVIEAYRNEALWDDLSLNGLKFMENNFSYALGLKRLKRLIDEITLAQ